MIIETFNNKEIFAINSPANVVGSIVVKNVMQAGTVLTWMDGDSFGVPITVESSIGELSESNNITDLHIYADNNKTEELTQGTDFTLQNTTTIELNGHYKQELTSVFASYKYGGSNTQKEEVINLVVRPNGPALGILVEDNTEESPKEVGMMIAGYANKDFVPNYSPVIEKLLSKIVFK